MVHDPGTHYAYCSANTNLVGGALTTATRTWLPELFERTVARSLQFGRYHWPVTANGEGYQGGGAFVNRATCSRSARCISTAACGTATAS